MFPKWPSVLALALPLLLGACRKEAPTPPLRGENDTSPAAAAASALESPPVHPKGCPRIPAFAQDLPEDVFVEVLHIPKRQAGRDGVGYRLFENGRMDTYSALEFFTGADGKVTSRKVKGSWSTPGGVEGAKLDEMRKLVLETPRDELEKWSPKRAQKDLDIDVTLIRLRNDGKLASGCYFGDHAPPPMGAIERAIHDLRGTIKTSPKPEASPAKPGKSP